MIWNGPSKIMDVTANFSKYMYMVISPLNLKNCWFIFSTENSSQTINNLRKKYLEFKTNSSSIHLETMLGWFKSNFFFLNLIAGPRLLTRIPWRLGGNFWGLTKSL